jgi:hypothetical protein
MKMLSLEPDEDMKWIYDQRHPDYSDRVKDLRNRRDSAIRNAPRWMIEEARMNDVMRKMTPNAELTGQTTAQPLAGPR